jgi:Domain of unknown function (DUF4349)
LSAPDIELLEATLREDAPQADPVFAHDLDRRVAEGFARERRFRFRPPLMPALAAASVLLVLAVVGLAVLGGDEEQAPVVRQTSTTAADSLAAAPPAGAQALRAAPAERKVQRSIQLTLATARGKLADVAGRVGEVTSAHGGYVLTSNLSTGTDGTRSGEFTLRIPSDRLEPALAELGRLGEVRARNESSQDLTARFSHTEDRLANALLERRQTADRLRTASGAEAERLRARLRELTFEVRGLTGQMRDLRRKTAMSTVNVRLEEKAPDDGGGFFGGGPGAALDDVSAVLVAAFNGAIRLLPLAFLVLLGWLGAAALRRRRREAALF